MNRSEIAIRQIMMTLQAANPDASKLAFMEFIGDMDGLESMFHLMTNNGPARALMELERMHSNAWQKVAKDEYANMILEGEIK